MTAHGWFRIKYLDYKDLNHFTGEEKKSEKPILHIRKIVLLVTEEAVF
jgi:hypothetical protein